MKDEIDFQSDAPEWEEKPSPPAPEEMASERARYLRLAADFDNYRKRTQRDSEQRAAAQKDAFIQELLPVVDNLERALASQSGSPDDQTRRGVEMTLQQLLDLLRRHGVEAEESTGRNFDPARHEALSARFEPGRPDHTVVEVVQRGYCRGNEVIRPARVIINDSSLGGTGRHGG